MESAVKIRTLFAPPSQLSDFDPGEYLGTLEFYETNAPITEEERDGLAQFTHFLAFLALQAKSTKWATSVVKRKTLAYRALESHFAHLEGWPGVTRGEPELHYRELAIFLMKHYPPHLPRTRSSSSS